MKVVCSTIDPLLIRQINRIYRIVESILRAAHAYPTFGIGNSPLTIRPRLVGDPETWTSWPRIRRYSRLRARTDKPGWVVGLGTRSKRGDILRKTQDGAWEHGQEMFFLVSSCGTWDRRRYAPRPGPVPGRGAGMRGRIRLAADSGDLHLEALAATDRRHGVIKLINGEGVGHHPVGINGAGGQDVDGWAVGVLD